MFSINGETSPSRCWSIRVMDTTLFKQLHEMPDQLQWWVVWVQSTRVPFGSFVIEFLNSFKASIWGFKIGCGEMSMRVESMHMMVIGNGNGNAII